MPRSKSKKSADRIVLYIIASIIIFIFLGFAALLLHLDFFKVKKIELSDSIFYERDDLLSSIEKVISSDNKILSVFGPRNILFWKLSDKDSLAKGPDFPYASDISTESNFWDREVKINLEENSLKGVLCSGDSKCFAFDGDGLIYAEAPYVEGSLIFNIKDQNTRKYVVGRHFLPQDKWIDRMFKSVSILKEFGFDIEEVYINDLDLQEWEVVLGSGVEVRFSFKFIPEDLGQVMKNISSSVDFDTISYIDLKVPGRVYYK